MRRLDEITSPNFSGHESFPFRHGWLKKGYDALCQHPDVFLHEDALVKLGVGKNMVYSIRHWMVALELARPGDEEPERKHLTPTPLAHSLLHDEGWDPYLEDDGTLWVLHRRLVMSENKATTWWWVFHRPHTATLQKDTLLTELGAAAEKKRWRATQGSLKRDVDCFIRMYLPQLDARSAQEDAVTCPLSALGLLESLDQGEYILSYGWQPSLPDDVFRWGLAEYLNTSLHQAGHASGTCSLDQLLFDEGSPGRVFRLGESALVERLATLHATTAGDWDYDETVGLRQLVVRRAVEPDRWLRTYYDPEPQRQLLLGGAT